MCVCVRARARVHPREDSKDAAEGVHAAGIDAEAILPMFVLLFSHLSRREKACARESERERVCVCMCARERERERERKRARERARVRARERESEREREQACARERERAGES